MDGQGRIKPNCGDGDVPYASASGCMSQSRIDRYHSGAKAMTTNQTIDGVPGLRSLLERVTSQSMGMSAKKDRAEAAHELRALLEAESAPCAKSQVEPASQPRGETVAWHCVGDIGTEHVTLSQDCADAWFSHGGRSLPLVYAEQPAQVAVALPVDPERERLMEIVQQYPNVDPLKYDAAVRTLRK